MRHLKFNLQTLDDLYTAVGAGDVRVMQVINFIHLAGAASSRTEIGPKVKTRKLRADEQKRCSGGAGRGSLNEQAELL